MDRLDAEIFAWISKAVVVKGGPGSGDYAGHPYRGNQYTGGIPGSASPKTFMTTGEYRQALSDAVLGGLKENWGDKNLTRNALKDVKPQEGETKTAAQVMEAVDRYADANPDTMNGYSDKASHEKFIAEHEDAIPKWLIDKVTQKDVSVLEDNNYHTANTVIASQRPDLKGWTNEKALAQWDTQKSASEIQKGDLPGHAFRGNQWTSLGAKAEKLNDAVKLLSTRNTSMATRSTPEEIRSLARVHLGVAMQHIAVVEQHDEMPYLIGPQDVGAEAHQALMDSSYEAQGVHDEAANAHQEAAATLIHVAEMMESGAAEPAIKEAMYEAKTASAEALAASREGDKTSLPHPVGDSEFSDLSYKLMVSDRQDEQLGKSTEITKGDFPGHPFRGNQYSHGQAASDLRDLAASARAANEKSRLKTDVLGISGARSDKTGNYNRSVPTYSTPRYLQSQTENAKEHNEHIADHAEALADQIESDTSKPVEQHIADFQNDISGLRGQGQFHTSVDNYDTGGNYYRSANAGQAVVDHISQGMKASEPATSDEPQYSGGTTSEIAAGLQEGIRSGRISSPTDMDNFLYDSGFDGDPTELF